MRGSLRQLLNRVITLAQHLGVLANTVALGIGGCHNCNILARERVHHASEPKSTRRHANVNEEAREMSLTAFCILSPATLASGGHVKVGVLYLVAATLNQAAEVTWCHTSKWACSYQDKS
jgi:hypothetical protein